jgi:hypothetical protein
MKYRNIKTCSVCRKTSEETEFYALKSLSRCKSCNYQYCMAWKQANPEAQIKLHKKSYEKRREKILSKRKAKWDAGYREDPVKTKERNKIYMKRLKDAAFEAYGGYVCKCCGETAEIFLCLDHIDGGGGKHRKEVGSGADFYRWLRNNQYPKGLLQVLCHNCNIAKSRGGCPHASQK